MKKLALLLSLLFSSMAFSDSAGDVLQNKLNQIRSLSANFVQVVKSKQKELSRSTGTMALERPGRFRWQTKDPMEQLVVADGEQLWVYDVDLEQVTVKKQEKGVGGTAALFLSGYNDTVTRDFDVSEATKGNTQVYDLRSKSNKANFERVKLIFVAGVLNGIEMYDQLGQHTIVNLKNVKTNPKLTSNLFKFKPPKGTDVVQQ
ncbi:outer membrane lipoprotein chaperone LolA [Legionella jordanis]|uniref:Outer-membrane lipoprotein carrier protein n=1 Tax=Legionella jordanis TaxID=456 RepID=A0A0W0V9C9_9GAMM|nr:outer membrane lipoprotein chaperone LolA [Legionella jordanis]KTD16477.1 outer membrane lipoprotein carrier protein [Legionella jordanis]RMX03974.1 outer membrane lipoprotein carrier protein LolA [Legionella jordanis]RMX21956.1 outer membrane lipoprotein carrier protein LolA [Legionella jordanis]VEH12063.1 outer membrane lipoprotein carrier protein [Legionella jordanis]HAT8712636.1 outer membrane lipoprotein chaperone LolA [Legionella jordanis]